METPRPPRDRSLFFPIILIGIGVVWLLLNFNLIPAITLGRVVRLWPLFLIAAGLELLLGRGRAWVSAVIGLLTVGAAIALLAFGQQLGLNQQTTLKTSSFDAPREGAEHAQVTLDLASYATDVDTVQNSEHLVEAELTYAGEAVFDVSGVAQRQVLIAVHDNGNPFDFFDALDAHWQIGLSPAVPLGLTIDGGSGSSEFHLQELDLDSLSLDGGSGSVRLDLPADSEGYTADVSGGSGTVHIEYAGATEGTLRYDGGSGSLTVNLPDGQAARVEVQDSGSGGVRLPSGWTVIEDGNNDEGTWQTPGFDEASVQLIITITGVGSGSITVQE